MITKIIEPVLSLKIDLCPEFEILCEFFNFCVASGNNESIFSLIFLLLITIIEFRYCHFGMIKRPTSKYNKIRSLKTKAYRHYSEQGLSGSDAS